MTINWMQYELLLISLLLSIQDIAFLCFFYSLSLSNISISSYSNVEFNVNTAMQFTMKFTQWDCLCIVHVWAISPHESRARIIFQIS